MANGTKVTNLGLANIVAAEVVYTSAPKFIGWGTGTTTPTVGATDLAIPGTHEARTTGTPSSQQTTVANDTLRVVGTVTCLTAGKAITEAALWDTADADPWTTPAGAMFVKTVFDVINVAIGDGIAFTFNTAFSDNS